MSEFILNLGYLRVGICMSSVALYLNILERVYFTLFFWGGGGSPTPSAGYTVNDNDLPYFSNPQNNSIVLSIIYRTWCSYSFLSGHMLDLCNQIVFLFFRLKYVFMLKPY